MATTNLDVVRRALRLLGVLASGKQPTGAMGADGLEKLQDTLNDLPLFMRGEWRDVFLTSADAYAALDGDRIHTQGHAAAITLPLTYTDECNNTLATKDLARVQILGGDQAGVWVYSASKGAWTQADALELSGDFPLGEEDVPGFAALLAVSMSPEYGEQAQVSDATVAIATRANSNLHGRFYREVNVRAPEAFLRGSRMGQWGWQTGLDV